MTTQRVEFRSVFQPRYVLIALVGLAFVLHIWGIRQDLPYLPQVDEVTFVPRAVHMAATGNLNPGWFGHPGSTVIYTLAASYHIWDVVAYHGNISQPDPELSARFKANSYEFYILGRLLIIAYSTASLVFVYLVGVRAFGECVGVMGAWLALMCPLAVSYAQIVRTDSAAVFFGVLALWCCLRLYDRSTLRNQALAGVAIGLAIATRYFMVALIPVLLAVDSLVTWQQMAQPPEARPERLNRVWLGAGVGLLSIAAAFALTSPYVFLDFKTAFASIAYEAQVSYPGYEGFTPLGNLWWYLTQVIPSNFYWPQTLLAGAGIGLVIWQRKPKPALLFGFIPIFLAGICLSALHRDRWLIEILPILALMAANAIETLLASLSQRLEMKPPLQSQLLLSSLVLISIWPMVGLVQLDLRQTTPSTMIQAREWILANIPAGSHIAEEDYTAPLWGTNYVFAKPDSLATNHSVHDYYLQGYRYMVASDWMYGRYLAEPSRYRREIAFYQALSTEKLLQSFNPSPTRAGPTILINELCAR
jgi:hypothetical protein